MGKFKFYLTFVILLMNCTIFVVLANIVLCKITKFVHFERIQFVDRSETQSNPHTHNPSQELSPFDITPNYDFPIDDGEHPDEYLIETMIQEFTNLSEKTVDVYKGVGTIGERLEDTRVLIDAELWCPTLQDLQMFAQHFIHTFNENDALMKTNLQALFGETPLGFVMDVRYIRSKKLKKLVQKAQEQLGFSTIDAAAKALRLPGMVFLQMIACHKAARIAIDHIFDFLITLFPEDLTDRDILKHLRENHGLYTIVELKKAYNNGPENFEMKRLEDFVKKLGKKFKSEESLDAGEDTSGGVKIESKLPKAKVSFARSDGNITIHLDMGEYSYRYCFTEGN